jgi:PD-(D/E)XK nuclease superfamily
VRLDGSAFTKFRFCGLAYKERYEEVHPDALLHEPPIGLPILGTGDNAGQPPVACTRGLVSTQPTPDRDFGTRFHQLVANHRRLAMGQQPVEYPDWPSEDTELECQAVWAQYQAHYVGDALRILSVERTESLAIPGTEHELAVRIDAVVRYADGTIGPLDTKTEKHGSRSNTRESWIGRTQAALYLWACRQLYPQENVSRMVIDVVTRGSAKFPPAFRRMDDIAQSHAMQEDAVRNLAQAADEIAAHRAAGWWPSNKNSCVDWTGRPCEYFDLHILGRTDANLRKYRPAEDYLSNEI